MSKLIIRCPICDEKKKDRKSLVFYDKELSDKSNGKSVYFCTNKIHTDTFPHWIVSYFAVKDVIISVRNYVMDGRLPK